MQITFPQLSREDNKDESLFSFSQIFGKAAGMGLITAFSQETMLGCAVFSHENFVADFSTHDKNIFLH